MCEGPQLTTRVWVAFVGIAMGTISTRDGRRLARTVGVEAEIWTKLRDVKAVLGMIKLRSWFTRRLIC